MGVSGSKGPAHYDDYHDHSEREKREEETTGRRGDYNDTSRYYKCMSSFYDRMCDYHCCSPEEEERLTTTTGDMTAQRG